MIWSISHHTWQICWRHTTVIIHFHCPNNSQLHIVAIMSARIEPIYRLPCSLIACTERSTVRCTPCWTAWCPQHMPPCNKCQCNLLWHFLHRPDLETPVLQPPVFHQRFMSLRNPSGPALFSAYVCEVCAYHGNSYDETANHCRTAHWPRHRIREN